MGHKRFAPDLSIALILFAGNLLMIGPYLLMEFSPPTGSNDYTNIALARTFRDYPWSWNPLQYCGAPFRYTYPPLFHLLVMGMPVRSLGRGYHLLSGIGYAFVPASLYILALQLFRCRLGAAFAAVVYSVLPSPVYLLPLWRNLAHSFADAPWPFVALVGYNEAAHTLSLGVMLLAIAAAWQNRWTAASLCGGAVFLLSWLGIIGLLMALISAAIARARDFGYARSGMRLLATAGVAYGLAAFWMTPGYFHATALLNRVELQHEQAPAPWSRATWAALIVAAALLTLSLWRRTPPVAALLLSWLV